MISFVLVTLTSLQSVKAWGSLGHATIAYIAQNYITDEVASWAQGVLNDTSDSYLANIASWADTYRATTAGSWSSSFHYIDAEDNPPSDCNVDYDRDCGDTGCSISAIANYTQRVGDGRLSAANTAQALKFLVHLVGDITQPLHDEAYEVGGNDVDVTYQGYSDNLHSDWDTYIPETLVGGYSLSDAQRWASNLTSEINAGDYKSLAASWIDGDDVNEALNTALRWAQDANAYVCTVVMPDGAAALEALDDLYPTYYDSVIPTVELQVAKGGYRLGNWLNLIYKEEIAKRDLGAIEGPKRDADKSLPDLLGRELLPTSRSLSKAKLARASIGYGCGHAERKRNHH
ncbi:hypothetical protein VPNG_05793 [Cytospora leucostoma]|uniref:Nuclease PA3 n=1 Tax=Cytospora leucostoma TaxID=1230097 RepID=A0A423X0C9_9PEZI|nr:hypothetical protein VPNG_05793 [Cytospora leucostoma]